VTNIDRLYDCMVCGGSENKLVCEKLDAKYVSCSCCQVVRQYPYPNQNEMDQYYTNYQTKKSIDSDYLTEEGFSVYKRDKDLTFKDLGINEKGGFTGKSILDVGCGTGHFLKMMSEGTKLIKGIDKSEECINVAKGNGLNCISQDFLLEEGVYDVITMWHLIEHILNPVEFIEHAYRQLSPGGWLLIETPVIGAVSASFGEHWRFFMPVEHINLFTQNALFRSCVDHGFKIDSWVRHGSGNDGGSINASNKRAMDRIAKEFGFGDTLTVLLVK
jgi:SAM-dependent methyltransferase